MAILVCPAEIVAQRWARSTERAAYEILAHGGPAKEVARALATYWLGPQTLSRRVGSQLSLTIPGAIKNALGWEAGTLVQMRINERGSLEIAAITEEDLPGFAERLAEPGYVRPAPALPPRDLMCYERTCKHCGLALHAVGSSRQCCEQCRERIRLENARRRWQRNRKRTPSYLGKLKWGRRSDSTPVTLCIERPCRRCHRQFLPTSPCQWICAACRIKRARARVPREEVSALAPA